MSALTTLIQTGSTRIGNKGPRLSIRPFQSRVRSWIEQTFDPENADDHEERDCRFMEEAIELFQARGRSIDQLWKLAQYVYSREPGEVEQELGGVLTTAAALSAAARIDMFKAAETELARIWTKKEAIRAKRLTNRQIRLCPATIPARRSR
jgi:NTP pyrophosphatase (non-canonical NTP hydrolase)